MDLLAYEGLALTANYIMITGFRVNLGGPALGPAQDVAHRHWMADPDHNASDTLRTKDVYGADNEPDYLPTALFQSARLAPEGEGGRIGLRYSVWRRDPRSMWYFRYYMAEIDPRVDKVGLRVYDLRCGISKVDNDTYVDLNSVEQDYDILENTGPSTASYQSFYDSIDGLDDMAEVEFSLIAENAGNGSFPALLSGVEGSELKDAPLETWVLVSPALAPDEGLAVPPPSPDAGGNLDEPLGEWGGRWGGRRGRGEKRAPSVVKGEGVRERPRFCGRTSAAELLPLELRWFEWSPRGDAEAVSCHDTCAADSPGCRVWNGELLWEDRNCAVE